MQTWTIIGGGIHAVTIAIKLKSLGLDNSQLSIIDPHPNLCAQFNDYTHRIEMPYLRSPCVHHVHPNPFHLNQYAKKQQYLHASYGPYKRPNRDMFMAHTHELIHQYDLNSSHIQGKATQIKHVNSKWYVQYDDVHWIESSNVIIAFGCNHQPYIPPMFNNQPNVSHIFNEMQHTNASHVVGSGISAAHLALKLLNKQSNAQVHLWTNKPIEVHDFDADTGWLGPKNMKHFNAIQSSQKRYDILKEERHKGSMPKELELRLKKHIKQARLKIHINKMVDVKHHHIVTEQSCIRYDHILLATGFEDNIMQQPIIKQLVNHYQAPVSTCGLPSISTTLEWLPNLYVTGGLADLELGPFARNIMGGREAALRIADALHGKVMPSKAI
ncbi:NAD(P)-binding domain-containing protein [Staphylococcus caeli]|uniref:Pyridine nucleotide-disulfide oxidoreductase family protein n=1 Tax=Staphylococcus caeli TaxID=2201815 RepID=A0A1D4LNF3_9STAP|nr:FAD/NAD(P)-binding protein [Staphylococcus caeli]SCS55399.1 pyridine nucleotide-disulfide oxidoreductase family protein [Staphylococcus caeli]SCS87841.1 pyridine nucleotide-disulfide oxidoreductase family protein [Staphylococcus caeli]